MIELARQPGNAKSSSISAAKRIMMLISLGMLVTTAV